MKLLMHRINRTDQNVHIQRNIEMFRKLGIEVRDVYNGELLRGDLSGADAICLNWFENIDGGRAFMPPLRYARRLLQLHRIKKAGLSLLFYMHNRFPHNPRYPKLSRDLYHRLAKQADVILTFAEESGAGLEELFPGEGFGKKTEVIRPLNYIGAYPPNPDAPVYEMRKKAAGKLLVCFLGKISPYKNVELIIRAAKEPENEDVAFLLCGEPVSSEYRAELEALAAPCRNLRTDFRLIPDSEMAAILDVSDLLAMPYDTRSAANSGTGRLAFSYARSVVTPDIPSMNAIPDELIYKYHYDSPDEHYEKFLSALKRACADWQRDPERLREKGRALKKLMETDYSEQAVMEQYRGIFRRLEDKRRSR